MYFRTLPLFDYQHYTEYKISIYPWSYMRYALQNVFAMQHKSQGWNPDGSTDFKGIVQPWTTGPPSISSSKKKTSIGNRYEYYKHRT